MSINPVGLENGPRYWNYHNENKEDFMLTLEGVVIAIQQVQKHQFGNPGAGEFWPDGKPKMNIRIALQTEDGKIKMFEFQPASKAARMGQKPSIHMDLFNLSNGDMRNLIGVTIAISTQPGQYGVGNPRPFSVGISAKEIPMPESIPEQLKPEQVLRNASVSGGQMMQPQQQYQPQPQHQYQQQPQYQPQPYQQPQQQYQPQPYQPQPQQQYQPQPYQPQPQYQQQPQQQYQPQPQPQQQQYQQPYDDIPF